MDVLIAAKADRIDNVVESRLAFLVLVVDEKLTGACVADKVLNDG